MSCCLVHHCIDAGQLTWSNSRKEMAKREHGVRFAATKVGLELPDRIAPFACQALHRPYQHSLQTLSKISAAEKFSRIPLLVSAFAQIHLP